jgi:3'-5' exonuclease
MSAGYRVLDIETVPDLRFWSSNERQYVERPMISRDGAVLLTGHADGWVRTETEWVEKEQFPPPQAHRVVAISWVELSGEDGEWYKLERTISHCQWSRKNVDRADELELDLLRVFGEAQSADKAILVTWNGRTFDLPVINLRSFYHGLPCAWYYEERDVRYRYSESGHCDLMDVFSDYGAGKQMKLGDAARLIGLPGKTGTVKGSEVGRIYDEGDIEENMDAVGRYCLGDSLQTALLFARSRVHKGMVDIEHYRNVILPSFLPELEKCLGVRAFQLR